MVRYNAIILAGGRSSRLGGTPKAGLSNGHHTLLESTLESVQDALMRVVVGPDTLPLPAGVLQTVEKPRFAGPAAALCAGILKLPVDAAEWTLVLSVDMPNISTAVKTLVASSPHKQGFMGVTDEIIQPLAGIYDTSALRELALNDATDQSVRRLLGRLDYELLDLPSGSTQDVDTWEDAQTTGFTSSQW